MSLSYVGTIKDTEAQTLLEEPALALAASERRTVPRLAVFAVLAALACVGVVIVGRHTAASAAPERVSSDTVTLTEQGDPCAAYDFLNMTTIKQNKLDDPQVGLVFGGEDVVVGQPRIAVDFHITTPEAHIEWPDQFMGFHGHFMAINAQPAKEMRLALKVTEPDVSTPKTVPKAYITFFDLDSHAEGNAEYVCVDHFFNAFVTKDTELLRTEEDEDGIKETCFTATTVGTGLDNPTNPLSLTAQQLNRAVTFEFRNFAGLSARVGSTEHSGKTHGRSFNFVARPSVLCAEGSDPGSIVTLKGQDNDVGAQCCLLQVATLSVACTKPADAAFWQRMCSFARRLDAGSALAMVSLLLLATVTG